MADRGLITDIIVLNPYQVPFFHLLDYSRNLVFFESFHKQRFINKELIVVASVLTLRGLECPRAANFFTIASILSSAEVAFEMRKIGISA